MSGLAECSRNIPDGLAIKSSRTQMLLHKRHLTKCGQTQTGLIIYLGLIGTLHMRMAKALLLGIPNSMYNWNPC
jgi:hypothetical protein